MVNVFSKASRGGTQTNIVLSLIIVYCNFDLSSMFLVFMVRLSPSFKDILLFYF